MIFFAFLCIHFSADVCGLKAKKRKKLFPKRFIACLTWFCTHFSLPSFISVWRFLLSFSLSDCLSTSVFGMPSSNKIISHFFLSNRRDTQRSKKPNGTQVTCAINLVTLAFLTCCMLVV